MAEIDELLSEPLDPDRIQSRNQGGRNVGYIEGFDVIDNANRIFGFGGWDYRVEDITAQTFETRTLYRATVTIKAHGASRTDVGVSTSSNDTADAHDTAIKGAVTDGLKRAFRTFGSQFGNSLYSKSQPPTKRAQAAPPMCLKHNVRWQVSKTTGKRGHVLEDGTPCIDEAA